MVLHIVTIVLVILEFVLFIMKNWKALKAINGIVSILVIISGFTTDHTGLGLFIIIMGIASFFMTKVLVNKKLNGSEETFTEES